MMTEKQKEALAKVKEDILAMGPEEFRKKMNESQPGNIAKSLAELEEFSNFLKTNNE